MIWLGQCECNWFCAVIIVLTTVMKWACSVGDGNVEQAGWCGECCWWLGTCGSITFMSHVWLFWWPNPCVHKQFIFFFLSPNSLKMEKKQTGHNQLPISQSSVIACWGLVNFNLWSQEVRHWAFHWDRLRYWLLAFCFYMFIGESVASTLTFNTLECRLHNKSNCTLKPLM